MSRQENCKLNRAEDHLPPVGFGTARIADKDTEEVIYNAIKTSYRLFDAALSYSKRSWRWQMLFGKREENIK